MIKALAPMLAPFLALMLVLPALAEAPKTSPRPRGNPALILPTAGVPDPVTVAVTADPAAAIAAATPPVMRPRPRPEGLVAPEPPAAEPPAPETLAAAPLQTGAPLLRPRSRPEGLALPEAPVEKVTMRKKKTAASRRGSVCGVASIKGEVLSPVKSKVKGCGIADPVRISSVGGVRLSQAATIDCDTARALDRWVGDVLQPAFGKRQQVVELTVAAHYICRPRNNQKGNKISEHGRGKAIDIGGFVLADGTRLSVLNNYNKTIRKAHKGACGIFGTTLGPGSDGFHEDHLHFDTAGYRSGPYCR